MRLEDLRKLSAARTSGIWVPGDYLRGTDKSNWNPGIIIKGSRGELGYHTEIADSGSHDCKGLEPCDAAFIAAAANHFDRLLDVVEAARDVSQDVDICACDGDTCLFCDLRNKLEELERDD